MESKNFTYKYLKFVSFSGLELWDTKRYNSKKVNSSFDLKQLYNCIIEQSTKYKIFEEKETEFKILGVNNKEGIFDAYILKGKDINQPYKKMQSGWIAYNPYRINVGSIGIKLNEHKYEYISPAYVVFSCKENLLPEYLFMIFKTELFNNIIKESTTGSVRQNLTFDSLKKLQIPLPSLEEQNRLVENYAKKIKVAEKQEQEAVQLEHEIENYLLEELGVEKQMEEKKQPGKLIFFHLKKVDRWDVWNKKNINSSNIFLNKILDDVIIGKPMYGANVKGVKIKSDTRYIRITDINENGDLNNDFIYPEVTEEKYLLENNDFLIARSGNTVGKTFLYKKEHGKAIFAGYLVKYKLNNKVILPEYLLIFSKSKIFKDWVLANQRISGQPNINGQEFLKSPIIIPPLEKQKEIVAYITNLKNKIKKLHILAKKNREEAIKEFEQEIFNS